MTMTPDKHRIHLPSFAGYFRYARNGATNARLLRADHVAAKDQDPRTGQPN